MDWLTRFKQNPNKLVLITLAVLSLSFIGFVLVIRNYQSKELKDVLASPMANLQISTGEEVEHLYYDRGTTLGKPSYVEVLIFYKPKYNQTNSAVFNELVNNMKELINNSKKIIPDGENLSKDRNYYSTTFSYKKYLRLEIAIYELLDENRVVVNIKNYGNYPGTDILMKVKGLLTL